MLTTDFLVERSTISVVGGIASNERHSKGSYTISRRHPSKLLGRQFVRSEMPETTAKVFQWIDLNYYSYNGYTTDMHFGRISRRP